MPLRVGQEIQALPRPRGLGGHGGNGTGGAGKERLNPMARLRPSNTHKRLADIFSKMKRPVRKRLMQDLEQRDGAAAEQIRALMFTFEDLGTLESRGIRGLLRHVDRDQLALALKGAPEALKAAFFANMSERGAKALREDMEAMGPVRAADAEKARSDIVSTALSLADAGEIIIPSGEDEYI